VPTKTTRQVSPAVGRWLAERPSPQLLPDPEPRDVRHTLISVDDHLVEPPWLFEGRVAQKYADLAPKMVENETGGLQWVFDGKVFPQMGLNALAGRRDRADVLVEPVRLADMRHGAFDIHERIRDMDLAGVWASVCFPSMITGFCGRVYSDCSDPEVGLAVTRAFNDWIAEEWHGEYPRRIVPMGITWLRDAEIGAAEIRQNAARGFTAVTLPEQPANIGLPSLHTGWWDPVLAACEETDTTICLHIGSSGHLIPHDPAGPGIATGSTMFQVQSFVACTEWIWSGLLLRFPRLKLAFSEGGIGWVPVLYDRLRHQMEVSGHGAAAWPADAALGPHEVLLRNCWFCTIDDPSSMAARDLIGIDRIMAETDYPHADGTWPDCQRFLDQLLAGLTDEEARAVSCENAARVFRHPLPTSDFRMLA
jgi:predicted TIM-barrel fold metal-dependent hydrolase